MKLSDFTYQLPPEKIAQTPVDPRDHSKLLVVPRTDDDPLGSVHHAHFYDLPEFLEPGDLLVVNNTRVLPVRLLGTKNTGGKIEVLLTKRLEIHEDHEVWQALTKPGLKIGQTVKFTNKNSDNTQLEITCTADEGYTRLVRTSLQGPALLSSLEDLGEMPTPPYIEKFVGDPERYQTIFSKHGGSAAAPTAGLHFTPELFARLQEKGIQWAEVTLHVGLGTFLPVKSENITEHHMHSEWYEISPEVAEKIRATRAAGHRIIAVGTTSMRTLESAATQAGTVRAESGDTELFVYPPHKFLVCDGLITNFHLPESTLLMLVSAFCSAPQNSEVFTNFSSSLLGRVYQEAIEQDYRFFSFGDAMLLL